MRVVFLAIIMLSTTLLLVSLAETGLAYAPSPTIRVDNTAKYSSGHYDWTLFIIADEQVLQNIDHVQYTLHPSFTNPVQIVRDRGGACAFALKSTSWGEFNVAVKVVYKNGSETNLSYWLNLLKNQNASGCDEKRNSSATRNRAIVNRRKS